LYNQLMSRITLFRSMTLALGILLLVGLACTLSVPTPAAWVLTPTAQAREATSSASAATRQAMDVSLPTVTPAFTPTFSMVTPTTPVTILLPDGPWLVYFSEQGKALIGLNADGSGRSSFPITPLLDVRDLQDGASPLGDWLAVRTGQDSAYKDLSIDLVHLPDGTVERLVGLLTPDLLERAKSYPGSHPEEAIKALIEPGALRWSPDGRYLAFVAAIDGVSSDLYLYDTQTRKIERLTSGSNQVATPVWSPDGLWLIAQEVDSFGDGKGWKVNNVWANGLLYREARLLYTASKESGGEVFLGWTAPGMLLVYSRGPIGGMDLRLFNMDKLKAEVIFAGPFDEAAYDPQSKTLAFIFGEATGIKANQVPGLYLMKTDEKTPRLAQAGEWRQLSWSAALGHFEAVGPQGVLQVTLDGNINLVRSETRALLSPNKSWQLCFADGAAGSQPGLRLFKAGGELMQSITNDAVQWVAWQPGSSGFFYLAGEYLFLVTFPDLQPLMIDGSVQPGSQPYLGWVSATLHK
jgi:hypothetical protein